MSNSSSASEQVSAEKIARVFNTCFLASHATIVEGGADEPFYQAQAYQSRTDPLQACRKIATIFYRADYSSSALHEIAHWCVAGAARRAQDDYGYWYSPDGRCAQQQIEFEKVEIKPQALEWVFSQACGVNFSVSADNLALNCGASECFERAIVEQAGIFIREGLPARAKRYTEALHRAFHTEALAEQQFTMASLKRNRSNSHVSLA